MVDSEHLRTLVCADPFQAFTLLTSAGKRVEVKHPGALAFATDGSVIFQDYTDTFRTLRTESITDMIFGPPLIETIRQLRNASPFVPFTVRLEGGFELRVTTAETIILGPDVLAVRVDDSPDHYEWTPVERIVSLEVNG